MDAPYIITRRRLLQSIAGVGAVSAASTFEGMGLASALAQTAPASDYKALVCVYLYGGNDANNLVVPMETADYNLYSMGRGGSTNGGIAIPLAELNPIKPKTLNQNYGLHPAMTPLKTLFDAGKMAVVCNTGTLMEPMSKAEYAAASKMRPEQLFSHSDQTQQWQTGISRGIARTGWGGRLADVMGPKNATNFPMITSISGSAMFLSGDTPRVIAIPSTGTFASTALPGAAEAQRLNAMKNIMNLNAGNDFTREADDLLAQALGSSDVINPIITANNTTITPIFGNVNNGISNQLRQVAKLIEARATIGVKRQIFFVALGGFDTHTNEIASHNTLYGQLGPALKAFYDATVQMGVANQVTTFTMSDFGRTLKQASGAGSDHGWGSHHMVIGGAVRGQEFYGAFPNHTLGGPSDLSTNGRWIPTTSVDQYGATMAKWFGVSATDMSTVFPNIRRFSNTDLGFLS
jgi:uncharacterized protein (DUF1501 family)